MILYHATYRKRIRSIKEFGLGAKQIKNWSISEDGVVYLATDPNVAASFCETAEDVSDSVYDSGIVVLAIDSRVLHNMRLRKDENIKDDSSKCFKYTGVINPSWIHVISKGNNMGRLVDLRRVPSYE